MALTFVSILLFRLSMLLICGAEDNLDKVEWMVYQPLAVNLTCFRKLNGTNEAGCGSQRRGNVGVVHVVSEDNLEKDVDWILYSGPSPPYSVAMDWHLVSTDLVDKLGSSKRVNGLLFFQVHGESERNGGISGYTEDDASPNFRSGLYEPGSPYYGHKWIVNGTGVSWRNWKIPIAIMQDNSSRSQLIHECFEKFNKPVTYKENSIGPLCAIEFTSRMYAAKDTPTCLRRTDAPFILSPRTANQCHALESLNIHSPIVAKAQPFVYPDGSVTVIAARMDTTAMFEHVGPASDSVVTSIVSFMAIAESLSSIRTELEKLNEFVHLMLFNGESTEYIGSSKMVYDMENNAFPSVASTDPSMNAMALMKINHIGRWIELDQVGTGDPKKLFVHFEPTSQSDASVNQKTSELKTKLKDAATGSGLVVEEASSGTSGLPPSSLHTFLKNNKKIAGVVLSGYNDRFVNQYYHSFKETPEATLNYSCGTDTVHEDLLNRLETVSTIVAKGLANLLGVAPPASPNRDKMAAMLDCYLCDSNCSLFFNISSQRYRPRLMPGVPFPLYTSVGNLAGFVYDVVNFTRRLLVSILGSEVPNVSQKECKQSENDVMHEYDWFMYPNDRNSCISSNVAFHLAMSPAFEIKGYDWNQNNYSTWTESYSGIPTARIFILPSTEQEVGILISGIGVTLISLLTALFCVQRRDVIYSSQS